MNNSSLNHVQTSLARLANRARYLNVSTKNGEAIDLAARILADAENLKDPAKAADALALHKKALEGDPLAIRTINAARQERWNNFVLPDANIISMFAEIVELADDEVPMFFNDTQNEQSISYVSPDGGLKRSDIIRNQSHEIIPLFYLTTPKMTFPLRDVYQGQNIGKVLEETLVVGADMSNKFNAETKNFLTNPLNQGGAFGAFDLSGDAWKRIYKAHSGVNTANFPKTNVVTVTGSTKDTKFRTDVVKAVAKYALKWGNAFAGTGLEPTGRILVPSGDSGDLMDELSVTSPAPNSAAESLITGSWMSVTLGNRNWTVVPDNTLDPADGACYPEFNRKPLRVYTKSSQDLDIQTGTGAEHFDFIVKNQRVRFMQKVYGAYLNAAMRHMMLKVIYRTQK